MDELVGNRTDGRRYFGRSGTAQHRVNQRKRCRLRHGLTLRIDPGGIRACLRTLTAFAMDCPMPMYFFHLIRNGARLVDEEGTELRDVDAAIAEAYRSTASIVRESVKQNERFKGHIEVEDEAGNIILSAPLPWPSMH